MGKETAATISFDFIKDANSGFDSAPPFKINGTSIVLGEEGDEYKKLLEDGKTLRV